MKMSTLQYEEQTYCEERISYYKSQGERKLNCHRRPKGSGRGSNR